MSLSTSLAASVAKEIIEGRRLIRSDDLSFLSASPLEELQAGANQIRKNLCGDHADLCTIINGRSGRCSEDCKFCAQSSFHHTGCNTYPLLDEETILADYQVKKASGVHAYSIVTSGRSVCGDEFNKLLHIYERLQKEGGPRLCASHGLLSLKAFLSLKKAGVTMYHANIETSRRFFPQICTTHTYDDKIKEIMLAKQAGLIVCSGGIIGMGETFEDRVDMALSLSELAITSIPINVLIPVKGTPLADYSPLSKDEILRAVAAFRYLNPTSYIRIAAGRSYMADGGAILFQSGANAAITGDMLTTTGANTRQDKEMLQKLGFEINR